MNEVSAERRTIRVVESFPGAGPRTNPYLIQLVQSFPGDVRTDFFSWRRAVFGRYDVLHVHWPDRLVRAGTPMKTLAKRLGTLLLLVRLAVTRTALVRTVHNPTEHEPGDRAERLLLRALDRRTALWIRLNPFTWTPQGAPVRTILHGHYRSWFDRPPSSVRRPERLLFFGLLRRYKGVEDLVEAFHGLRDHEARLVLAGEPADAAVADEIDGASRRDPRVEGRLGYLADAELAAEVTASQLVVLPYRSMHNSGAALLALSLDRPVLLPANEVTRWMRERIGAGWVELFEPPLTSSRLGEALAWSREPRESAPDLSDREWSEAGRLHAEAFRAALAARRSSAQAGRRYST